MITKRKNQNKCYCASVVALIIAFRNNYQIFRPITLVKYLLITNQYPDGTPSEDFDTTHIQGIKTLEDTM